MSADSGDSLATEAPSHGENYRDCLLRAFVPLAAYPRGLPLRPPFLSAISPLDNQEQGRLS